MVLGSRASPWRGGIPIQKEAGVLTLAFEVM